MTEKMPSDGPERVEDIEKARVMADAGDVYRTKAAEIREGKVIGEFGGRSARQADDVADILESYEASKFDSKKEKGK